MSKVSFDGKSHTLTLYTADGEQKGCWQANNRTDSHATLRFVPNGDYTVLDTRAPYRHTAAEDCAEGEYGSYGIVRFNIAGHFGVGIHAGRQHKPDLTPQRGIGPDHVTQGCIRTTEEAMSAITSQMKQDPLLTLTVQNNFNQRG